MNILGKKNAAELLKHIPMLLLIYWSIHYTWKSITDGEIYFPAWGDMTDQWRICVYTLLGADPYELRGVVPPLSEDVGQIGVDFMTSPWGCFLGNIFYPGYLPFEVIGKYFIAANVAFLLLTAYIVLKYLQSINVSKILRCELLILLIFSPAFWRAIHQGNCASMIGCLILMACFLHREFPILSGIFLGFAMIKPQTALIICFAFLLIKSFKPIIIAATLDIFGWLVTSVLINKTPLVILHEFLTGEVGGFAAYRGILTFWYEYLPSQQIIMPLSMLIGVIFVLIMHYFLRDCESDLIKLFPAIVASTFWSYSWENERFILFILILICITLLLHSHNLLEKLLLFLMVAFFQMNVTLLVKSVEGVKAIDEVLRLWYLSHAVCDFLMIGFSILLLIFFKRTAILF